MSGPFHSIHHSDRALDVTTTIRQHPGESVIRYFHMSVTAVVLGNQPSAASYTPQLTYNYNSTGVFNIVCLKKDDIGDLPKSERIG